MQFYGDTVKQMAVKQFVAGSPLRTLCLLISGQPADVFSSDTTSSLIPGSANTFQQPVQVYYFDYLGKVIAYFYCFYLKVSLISICCIHFLWVIFILSIGHM